MAACGHVRHLALRFRRFDERIFCKGLNAIENLARIQATLAGHPLPMTALEVISPVFSSYLLRQIARYPLPNFGARLLALTRPYVPDREHCPIKPPAAWPLSDNPKPSPAPQLPTPSLGYRLACSAARLLPFHESDNRIK
jgi:hypothetical protein